MNNYTKLVWIKHDLHRNQSVGNNLISETTSENEKTKPPTSSTENWDSVAIEEWVIIGFDSSVEDDGCTTRKMDVKLINGVWKNKKWYLVNK